MIGATFCSGIGAPEMAAPHIDWQLASEVEAFPRAVLQQRFGYRDVKHARTGPRLWADMTALKVRHFRRFDIPLPDLIVAGTPCQSFSVAGLRKGTADPRGNLTLQFLRTCDAIRNARPDGQLTVLWENVPGILSDRNNAFGSLLGGFVGALDALPPPRDASWPSEGMASGPRARCAWAVLNARWFGVAQQRRRLFLVVDFGNAVDPAAVLLEPDRMRGDPPQSRETGKAAAAPLGFRVEGHHGQIAGTVSAKWVKGSGGPAGDETQNIVAFDCKGTEVQFSEDGTNPPLRSMGRIAANENAGSHAAVAFNLEAREPHEPTTPLVRRLMPVECARLQGFPDDHTAIQYRGKPAADGPQYKAHGNSMAVPVIRYLIDRITISRKHLKETKCQT